jgi:electron transfer flavoprotein alpha subunit
MYRIIPAAALARAAGAAVAASRPAPQDRANAAASPVR